jgi:hypothetical protein
MNLRELSSNSSEVLNPIPDEDKVKDKKAKAKVLGMVWDTEQDTLSISHKATSPSTTKKGVLQTVSSIFTGRNNTFQVLSLIIKG